MRAPSALNLPALNLRAVACALASVPLLAYATVQYTLKVDVPSKSLLVSVTIDHPKPTETFQIPGWSPGYYVMEKYETKISGITAAEDGQTVAVKQVDPRTWSVDSQGAQKLTFSYKVLGDDVGLGFFCACVKSNTAYTNGPASFMYVPGRRDEDTSLKIEAPTGWKIATPMTAAATGTYTAHDYDEMADDPIEMGQFASRMFTVDNIPFEAIFVAPPNEQVRWNVDQETEVLRQVSKPAIDMFHGAPFKRYLYTFHLTGDGFQGGLEHRSGTVIAIPNEPDIDLSDLAAHEFFHAWNVKQIRPSVLGPFDYTQPQRTGNLWFAEGVTDYYAKICTYRSGVHDLAWLLDQFHDQIGDLQSGATRLTKTVEDSSRAAWENNGFGMDGLDYYNKGLLAGLVFDAAIRDATNGAKSLDDVMRYMYAKYRMPNPGYGEDGIRDAIDAVAGKNLDALYDAVIRSSQELPYDNLKAIGLEVLLSRQKAQVALGWPTPLDHIQATDLLKYGVIKSDRFIRFVPPAKPDTASFMVNENGSTKTVTVPLKEVRLPEFSLILDPTPTAQESEAFVAWTRR